MKELINLKNQIFGFLTVIEEAPKRGKFRYWLCECTCGTRREVLQSGLRRGVATHCGCIDGKTPQNMVGKKFGSWLILKQDLSKLPKFFYLCRCTCGTEKSIIKSNLRAGVSSSCMRCRKKGKGSTSHGKAKHRLYPIWCGMRERCNNTNSPSYKNYGGRGIFVCERWNSFSLFLEDMEDTYQEGLTIERIDSNSNYEPLNCTWIPKGEQSKNRRNVHRIEYRGEIYSQVELGRVTGVPIWTIEKRMKLGWTTEEVVNGKMNY